MLIRFGLHLDGLQPQPPSTAFDVVTLGPLGLLGVLETQLGLPTPQATAADLLIGYRACLTQADHPGRFYHASFALDPINVSRTLLEWRATLYEHGWDGSFPADVPSRLRDLGDVETLATARVPLNRGQRVRRAIAALDELDTQIERVELLDDAAELPRVWRVLLDTLGYSTPAHVIATPQAIPGSDLHSVQQLLVTLADSPDGRPAEKTRLNCDRTFVVLSGASRDITAQAVAECIIGNSLAKPATNDTVVIAEHDGIILDNACERAGLPRAGFQHYSRFRAVTQVLKLGLSLIWRPVSPHLLLQFLIHPVGPLPGHVRDALANAVAAQPGIGGRAWRQALDRIEVRMRDAFGADANAIATLKAAIDSWLGGDRFDPEQGAPMGALEQRALLCGAYLAGRMNSFDDDVRRSLFAGALAQSQALVRAIQSLTEQGQTHIKRIELDRLIDEVSSAAADANTFAQARHLCATTDPATITEPWRCVYWWDVAAPSSDVGYPWSRKELVALRACGVALFEVEALLRFRTRQWLRPILNAREQLTLVVHDAQQGHHPLWTQITNLFDNFVSVRVDDALINGEPLTAIGVSTRVLTLRALAAPTRWWQLPADAPIPPRDIESYSSLSKLFDYPHGYVLRYPAQLRPGRAQDLDDDNRLYGSLAHGLFERFFRDHPQWAALDPRDVSSWLSATLPALIEAEGAVLLEPGRGVDKQRVATTLERALGALLDHLHSAQIVSVQPEFHAEAAFGAIRLAGDIDMLLTDRSGNEIVLDVKWGGGAYRGKELRANRQLQLAIYAYLRRGAQRWPEQAFFIVESGDILAQDARVFPRAVTHPAASGETVVDLWQRISATYEWRRQQLTAGRVEVHVAATTQMEASDPPAQALAAASDPDRFDDFVNLTGWADHQ